MVSQSQLGLSNSLTNELVGLYLFIGMRLSNVSNGWPCRQYHMTTSMMNNL